MVTLQSVQGHTGLSHPIKFFDIRASTKVPECQEITMELDHAECMNTLVDSFLPQSEKVWD